MNISTKYGFGDKVVPITDMQKLVWMVTEIKINPAEIGYQVEYYCSYGNTGSWFYDFELRPATDEEINIIENKFIGE